MTSPRKKALSERDICTKFIVPALAKAGWDIQTQVREEVNLTKGRVMVSGRVHRRGEAKRADFLLDYKRNLPLAVIEAKDNKHSVGAGMQQALGYAPVRVSDEERQGWLNVWAARLRAIESEQPIDVGEY